MKYEARKLLWYLGLTVLFITCMFYFQNFGFFIIIIFFTIVFIDMKFRFSKGNIKQHNIESYKLLWEDAHRGIAFDSKEEARKSMNKSVPGLLISILFLSLSLYLHFRYLTLPIKEVVKIPILYFGFLTLLSVISFVGVIGFTNIIIKTKRYMKHGKTRKRNVLRVYEEGLCYLNYFITWDNLKSISWPKSFQASGIGNRIFYRSPSRSDTLKIMDKNEKVYLVEVSDKEGLSEIIKKRKKIK